MCSGQIKIDLGYAAVRRMEQFDFARNAVCGIDCRRRADSLDKENRVVRSRPTEDSRSTLMCGLHRARIAACTRYNVQPSIKGPARRIAAKGERDLFAVSRVDRTKRSRAAGCERCYFSGYDG